MDEPFDIFDPPKAPRERSGREQEHEARTSYRKYTKQGQSCYDCIGNTIAGNGKSIRPATVVRKEGQDETYLCGRHAQERRDREALLRD